MPGLLDGTSRKRKRNPSQVHPAEAASSVSNRDDEILLLETQILESRRNYNSITTLLGYVREQGTQDAKDQSILAAVALCRVFCRLLASGSMSQSRETSKDETVILQWLMERLHEYQRALLSMLALQDPHKSTTVLTLLMQLTKEGDVQLNANEDAVWCNGAFSNVLQTLVDVPTLDNARAAFVDKYFAKYDDIRYHTLTRLMWVHVDSELMQKAD